MEQLTTREFNRVSAVNRTGGWVGMFRTQAGDLQRAVEGLNADGYRVTFVVPDTWNFWQAFIAALVAILTLGFKARRRGFLIVAERING